MIIQNLLIPLLMVAGIWIVMRVIWSLIYNVVFHPLSKFPGPTLWVSTSLFRHVSNTRGLMDRKLGDMHRRFGPVVRYGPDALSFTSGAAWDDIFGYGQRPGRVQLRKVTTRPPGAAPGIINADDDDHMRLRGALVYAFSDRNIRASFGIMQQHVGELMATISGAAESKTPLNFTHTLDDFMLSLIGEWGWTHRRPNKAQSPRLKDAPDVIFTFMALVPSIRMRESFPIVGNLLRHALLPATWDRGRVELVRWARATVIWCLQNRGDAPRHDFISAMAGGSEKHKVSTPEMVTTTAMMIVAGTETTSTALTGLLYWLLSTPHAYKKLRDEIRSAFENVDCIEPGTKLNDLPYLKACISEGLRMYPPSPSSLSRITPPGPSTDIAGHAVAENTVVGIHQKAAYMCETNFHQAEKFLPERWLELDASSPFANDDRLVFQPFSYGPRDCLGRVMAYATLRLVVARIMYSYDVSLCDTHGSWKDQRIFQIWEKKPLFCYVRSG